MPIFQLHIKLVVSGGLILKQLNKYIVLIFIGIFLFSCGNKKKESIVKKIDTIEIAIDTIPRAKEDTTKQKDKPETEEPEVVRNEYFDDFIFHFATDKKFQPKRIVFPLPYYKEDNALRIEKHEWEHDKLFSEHNYYTLLFDNEDELEMPGDTDQNSIQLEWIYMKSLLVKKYYFERINGKWILEAINLHAFEEDRSRDFVNFFINFSTDSIFQSKHLANPLEFVTIDPDDDFDILETTIDKNQWFAFKPELPNEKFTNINYGQKNDDNSYTKIVHLKGIGNGFCNTLFFRKKQESWELFKFEDTSN